MVFDAKRGMRHARRQGAKITRTSQGIVVGDSEVSEKVATGLKELGYVERTTRARGGGVARTLVKLSATEVDLKVLEFVQDMPSPHFSSFISGRLGLSDVVVARSLERQALKVPNLKKNANKAWCWVNTPSPVSQEHQEPPTAVTEPPGTEPTEPEVLAPTEPVVPVRDLSGNNQGSNGAITKVVMPWMEAHPSEHYIHDIAAALNIDYRKVGSTLTFNKKRYGTVEVTRKGYWRWSGPKPVAEGHVLPLPPAPSAFVSNGAVEDWSARSHWDKVLRAMHEVDALSASTRKVPKLVDAKIKEHHTVLPNKLSAQQFLYDIKKHVGLVASLGEFWYLTPLYHTADEAQYSRYLDDLEVLVGPFPGAPVPGETETVPSAPQASGNGAVTLGAQSRELHLSFVGVSPLGQLYRAGDAYYLVSQFVVP